MEGTEDDCLLQSNDSRSEFEAMNSGNKWDLYDIVDKITSKDILKLIFNNDSDETKLSGF